MYLKIKLEKNASGYYNCNKKIIFCIYRCFSPSKESRLSEYMNIKSNYYFYLCYKENLTFVVFAKTVG